MYKELTQKAAKEVAHTLARVNHCGYATAVIDQHWEADFCIPVDGKDKSKGLLTIYECLDGSLGFLVSTRVEMPPAEDRIAAFLMQHINECVQEWEENGLVS